MTGFQLFNLKARSLGVVYLIENRVAGGVNYFVFVAHLWRHLAHFM